MAAYLVPKTQNSLFSIQSRTMYVCLSVHRVFIKISAINELIRSVIICTGHTKVKSIILIHRYFFCNQNGDANNFIAYCLIH